MLDVTSTPVLPRHLYLCSFLMLVVLLGCLTKNLLCSFDIVCYVSPSCLSPHGTVVPNWAVKHNKEFRH